MSISLTITIDEEKILITSEDGSLLSRRSNLVALDLNDQIVSIGKSLEELHSQRNTRILNPFAIEAFDSKLAGTAIGTMINSAALLLAEPNEENSNKRLLLNCNLYLPDYESLDHEVREYFEYYLQHSPRDARVKSLIINNQPKSIERFKRATQAILFGLILTASLLLWLFAKILQLTIPEQMAKPLSFLEIILNFAALACFLYLIGIIYIATCKATLKNVIPLPVYQNLIVNSNLSPEKIMSWIRQKLPFGQNGG